MSVAAIYGKVADEVKQGVKDGINNLVFFTPELLHEHKRW